MDIKFNKAKIIEDSGHWLCLRVENISQARHFIDNWTDKPHIANLKVFREKRSLNANAYAWVLITEIANILRADKDSIYVQMLERYGQSDLVSVKSDINVKPYFKYYVEAGQSKLNKTDFTHYKVYKGSSEFDTREMAILIDGIVYECKQMGIKTATPEELSKMCEEWNV